MTTFTTKQKLTTLRYLRASAYDKQMLQVIDTIIADLEHLPALVEAALDATEPDLDSTRTIKKLHAALAHFTEGQGGEG